jgi:hypothetical protein
VPPEPESDTEPLTGAGPRADGLDGAAGGLVDTGVVEEASRVVDRAAAGSHPEPTGAGPTGSPAGGQPGQPARRWVPWRALAVYAAFRVASVVAMAVVASASHVGLLSKLDIWDGEWFLRIVRHGYPAHLPEAGGHVAANPTAFFPVLPLLARALDVTGLPAGWSLLVVSAVTGATAVYGVGRPARHLAGDAAGDRSALLFAVFPGTFVFSLGYPEGIVITCVSLGLVALLRRRWWVAGLLGAVATAASPVALAFVVSCAWCAGRSILRERRFGALVAPVLAPLGFVAYMAYLRIHTGQLDAWRLTERGGWHSFASPTYPFRILGTFLRDPLSPTLTGQILFVGTVAAVIGVLLMFREHQPAPVLLYALGAVAAAAVSQPVGLRPRFWMLAFPMIIALGTRYEGRVHRVLVVVSAALLVAVSILEFSSWAVFP